MRNMFFVLNGDVFQKQQGADIGPLLVLYLLIVEKQHLVKPNPKISFRGHFSVLVYAHVAEGKVHHDLFIVLGAM